MKANSALLLFIMIIPLDVFAASYQVTWFLQGNHGSTSFTTHVDSNQEKLILNHCFSAFSFSYLMEGETHNDSDSYFWDLVNSPTHLSIGENNQATIQYAGNSAATINLFSLMHSQIGNQAPNDQSSINSTPVSAGLIPIPFLPASSDYLDGATIGNITPSHNSVQVSLNFIEGLQCDDCITNLTLTQEINGFHFMVHHSGSLDGEHHQFTLTTHISSDLMSVLINGESATNSQDYVLNSVIGIGALCLIESSHITNSYSR